MLNAAAIILAVFAGRATALLACHRSVPATDGSALGALVGLPVPGLAPVVLAWLAVLLVIALPESQRP